MKEVAELRRTLYNDHYLICSACVVKKTDQWR